MCSDGVRPPNSIFLPTLCLLVLCSSPLAVQGAERRAAGEAFSPVDRAHWSFRPIVRPAVPRVVAPDTTLTGAKSAAANVTETTRTPLDAFLLARLAERGLSFSPPASRRELIRRVTFDLTGLPPTPAEAEAFAADPAPDAYARLIERLLASPHYGEAWGRTWLDLVRFAETAGYKADPLRPLAWKYRDFVVRSFNANVPYNRFVQEQLAGDELFPDDVDAQIATGYLRMWPDESNASIVALARQDALNDLTGNVGSVFLGLSIGCAQCHDHKFDPIKQHDFYRLEAFFSDIVPVEKVAVG
jgi:hypothetical protein